MPEQIGHFRILGIGLELACNGGSCGRILLKRDKCNLHLKRLSRISLNGKLVPVQYREYENGLFGCLNFEKFVLIRKTETNAKQAVRLN